MRNLVHKLVSPHVDIRSLWHVQRSVLALPNTALPPVAYEEAARQRRQLLQGMLKWLWLGGIALHTVLLAHMWQQVFVIERWPPLAFFNYLVWFAVTYMVGGVLLWRKQFEQLTVLSIVATSIECGLQVIITGQLIHFSFVLPTVALFAIVLSVPLTLFVLLAYTIFLALTPPVLVASDATHVGIAIVTVWVFISSFCAVGCAVRRRIDDLAETMYNQQRAAVKQAQLEIAREQAGALATEQERMRIARELHDSVQHTLTATSMQLEACDKWIERDLHRARRALGYARSLTNDGIREVRHTVYALHKQARPETVSQMFAVLAEQFSTDELHAKVHMEGIEQRVATHLVLELYTVAQESLTNVRRHARASDVQMLLDFTHPEWLRMVIHDNGRGAVQIRPGVGLRNMRERIEALHGSFQAHTAPGEGFEIAVEVPYESNTCVVGG